MKIKKNKIFPYPVLSNMYDDYINCNFLLKVNAKKNRRKLVLAVEPVINCLTINNLLDEKKAKIVLHVECARTKHRQVFDLDKENKIFQIKSESINDNLQIVAFVVANEHFIISSLKNEDINREYGNANFSIEKGSILAISNQYDIAIDKDKFDLMNVNSIISVISKDDLTDNNIEFKLTDSKIRIFLPKDIYVNYSLIGKTENEFTPILHAMFVIPALAYALDYLKMCNDWLDIENNKWFKVIKKKCENKYKCDFDKNFIENFSSIKIAQDLIDSPYNEAIQNLLGMGDR